MHHDPTAQCQLGYPFPGARRPLGLKRIYRTGFAYKKTGIMLISIGPAARPQLSLLPQHGAGDKAERLMKAMDGLN